MNFFKLLSNNKKTIKDLSFLEVDMHSHLLPGIDDGAKNVTESIKMIKGLIDLGYKKIICTPHIYKEFYPNTIDTIQAALSELKMALVEEGIDIEIEAAAEYFLDEHFEELLEKDELLSFADEKYILVEMSFFTPTPNLNEILFKLITKGYQPVLAHPERYGYWANQLNKYQEVIDRGALLQLNILSLSNQYGKAVKSTALHLIKNGMYSFAGTDMHHKGHLDLLQNMLLKQKLNALASTTWKNIALSANSSPILSN